MYRFLMFAMATLVMTAPAAFAVVTKGTNSDYVVAPGKGRDGVVMVLSTKSVTGSGVLLASGRHVMSAKHIWGTDGPPIVMFVLPGGNKIANTTVIDHPNPTLDDVKILRLDQTMPLSVDTYELFRGNPIGQACQIVGFGNGGTGATGEILGTVGTRRQATNIIDRYNTDAEGHVKTTSFEFDFDDGTPTNNLTGVATNAESEGIGVHSDSGGAVLIGGKLAGGPSGSGKTTFGAIEPITNYNHPDIISWYDSVVPPVITSVIVSKGLSPSYAVQTGSGEQLRSVPVGGVDTLLVVFSEDVDPSATVSLVGKWKTYTLTKTWQSPRVLHLSITNLPIEDLVGGNTQQCDKLTLTVDNVKKPGTTGAALDGNWTNPASLGSTGSSFYPSGDGTPGTSFVFRFNVMAADCNRDNVVNSADSTIITQNQGISSGATFAQGDCNGDGKVDSSDTAIFTKCNGANYQ